MKEHLNIIEESTPWYHEGLKFGCTECGQCCTGAPGYVWVEESEVIEMAKYLQMEVDEFANQYIRRIDGKLALIEMARSYDCVFLKERKCSIYPVRPKQCKTFPWWPQNLKSKKDWEEAAKYCEGIRIDAPIIPLSTIQNQLTIQEGRT